MNSMTEGLIHKLMSVLEGSLSKLARYDEGSLIGSLMSFAVSLELLLNGGKITHWFECIFRMSLGLVRMWARVTLALCVTIWIKFVAKSRMNSGSLRSSKPGMHNR